MKLNNNHLLVSILPLTVILTIGHSFHMGKEGDYKEVLGAVTLVENTKIITLTVKIFKTITVVVIRILTTVALFEVDSQWVAIAVGLTAVVITAVVILTRTFNFPC